MAVLYYILFFLVLSSTTQTLFCTATMHTLHHRNLHKPLFPTSYQPQNQDPNFPSTPYTLNPPLPPPPPPFFPYNAYNPPPPPSLPTPKPEPKPKPSYPAFPISAIVLIYLPSFSIFVHTTIVLYRYLQIYKSREEIREEREIVGREKKVYEEKNIFHVNHLRCTKEYIYRLN